MVYTTFGRKIPAGGIKSHMLFTQYINHSRPIIHFTEKSYMIDYNTIWKGLKSMKKTKKALSLILAVSLVLCGQVSIGTSKEIKLPFQISGKVIPASALKLSSLPGATITSAPAVTATPTMPVPPTATPVPTAAPTQKPQRTPYRENFWKYTGTPRVTERPTASPKPKTTVKPTFTPSNIKLPTRKKPFKKPGKIRDFAARCSYGKQIEVSWHWEVKYTGFQLQYARNKKFTKSNKKKLLSRFAVSKTLTDVKKGKTYYIRLRAYNKRDNVIKYGKWSKTVKCKVSF